MNDKATTPTSIRLPDGLIRSLTKAAHKAEVSRTQYVIAALQRAVAHDLPTPEYQQAWEYIFEVYLSLEPDIMNSGAPNADMKMAYALETVLPQLRRMAE
jgi:hypothetical protein